MVTSSRTSTPIPNLKGDEGKGSAAKLCLSLTASLLLMLVTAACASPGSSSEASSEVVSRSRGQVLFESRCIACHGFYAPNRYSDEEWDEIIPDMAHEALLTRSQTKAVLEYVKSAN